MTRTGIALAAMSVAVLSLGSVRQTFADNFANVDSRSISGLENWMSDNRDKRIVSIASVLLYRSDVRGYIVQYVKSTDARQGVAELETSDLSKLQLWVHEHPCNPIVTFTTIPAYSGGLKGFVIVYDNAGRLPTRQSC